MEQQLKKLEALQQVKKDYQSEPRRKIEAVEETIANLKAQHLEASRACEVERMAELDEEISRAERTIAALEQVAQDREKNYSCDLESETVLEAWEEVRESFEVEKTVEELIAAHDNYMALVEKVLEVVPKAHKACRAFGYYGGGVDVYDTIVGHIRRAYNALPENKQRSFLFYQHYRSF